MSTSTLYPLNFIALLFYVNVNTLDPESHFSGSIHTMNSSHSFDKTKHHSCKDCNVPPRLENSIFQTWTYCSKCINSPRQGICFPLWMSHNFFCVTWWLGSSPQYATFELGFNTFSSFTFNATAGNPYLDSRELRLLGFTKECRSWLYQFHLLLSRSSTFSHVHMVRMVISLSVSNKIESKVSSSPQISQPWIGDRWSY